MKFIKEHILFLLVLFSCVTLRLLPLFDYQFTLDEWSGLDRTQFNSFSEVIEKGVKIDAHPAFVQLLIFYLVKFFGYTNWIIKLPFLLFSFGTIIYAYAFSLRNFSKQVGLIAAVFFSFSLIFVYYAPIARMYISGVFFSMGLLYYFFEIFFLKNTKPIQFFLFGLFALLSAFNQHINSLFAFTLCVSALFFLDKNNFKKFLITCVVVVLLYLPHLPVTLYQLGVAGIGFDQGGWLPKPEPFAVLLFLKVLLGTGRTYIVILSFIVLCFMANRQIRVTKKQFFLFSIFIINYLIIYLYSVFRAPVFQHSVMLFSATAIILLVSSLLDFKNRYFFYFVFVSIISVLIFKTYFKKDYLHQSVKNIFEFQFEKTFEYKKQFGEAAVYPIFFDADIITREICFKRKKSGFDCRISKDSISSSLKYFNRLISSLPADYLVLTSSNPQHQALAKDRFPFLLENIETQGLNLRLYSKIRSEKIAADDPVLFHSTYRDQKEFTYDKLKQPFLTQNGFVFVVDSLNEYPLGARSKLADVSTKEGQVIIAKAKIKPLQNNLKGVQLCISFNDLKTDSNYFYTSTQSSDFVPGKDSCITLYTLAYLGTSYKKQKDKSKITTFIWNTQKEKFLLMDLEIKTIDYWSKKWNFWE